MHASRAVLLEMKKKKKKLDSSAETLGHAASIDLLSPLSVSIDRSALPSIHSIDPICSSCARFIGRKTWAHDADRNPAPLVLCLDRSTLLASASIDRSAPPVARFIAMSIDLLCSLFALINDLPFLCRFRSIDLRLLRRSRSITMLFLCQTY
jgi:hypothetical protein